MCSAKKSLILLSAASLLFNSSDPCEYFFSFSTYLNPLADNEKIDPEKEMADLITGGNVDKSSFKKSVKYSADGSITVDLDGTSTVMRDNAKIEYDNFAINAHRVDVNFKTQYISAAGFKTKYGFYDPRVFATIDKISLFADSLKLNFSSQRAKFRNILLRSEDNILRADVAKKDVEDTFYAKGTFFTTCDLPHPHYGFYVERLKFKNQKKFVADRIYPVFNGVKIPVNLYNFVFLFPKAKHSGFIFPRFGENHNGFYAQDLGYYFYFNDYIDLALKTSLYTRGSFSVKAESNYIYRYHYKGNILYEISKNNKYVDSFNSKNVRAERDYVFKWQHESLDSKLRKFSINIDFHGVSPQDSALAQDNEAREQQNTHSTIRYSRQEVINRLYNLDVTLQHEKNFKTNVTSLTLPRLTLSSVPLHVFRFGRKNSKYFWDDIETKHNFEFTWKATTERKTEESGAVDDPYAAKKKKEKKKDKERGFELSWANRKMILKNAQCGGKHTLPVETNFKIFKYFNLRPYANFTLRHYFTRREYKDDGKFEEKHGFYNVWDYNGGAEVKTTIYGLLRFNPNGKVSAIRHKIDPSLSFTYTPDLSKDVFGFYQNFQGKKYNRFVGAIYGNAPDHRSAVISTKWDNKIEMKVNDKDEKQTVPVIEYSFGSGYDLLAPRFGMQDISFNASTQIGIVNVKYDATIDPYFHDFVFNKEKGKRRKERVNDFAWNHGQYLGTITKSSFSISTTLKSESVEKQEKKVEKYNDLRKKQERGETIERDQEDEQGENDLEENLTSEDYAPLYFLQNWQVNLEFRRDYSFDIDKEKRKEKHIFNISTDFQLTKIWRVNTRFVFDFDKEKLKYKDTQFGVVGDLHCWVLQFFMVPFGKEVSYDFSLGIKSSMLQSVRIPHRAKYNAL